MNRNGSLVLLAVLTAACLLGASPADAAVQASCVVGKNKCMSKKAGSLLKCHQKAETPGKPADPDFGGCITKAQAKFDGTPDRGHLRLYLHPAGEPPVVDHAAGHDHASLTAVQLRPGQPGR